MSGKELRNFIITALLVVMVFGGIVIEFAKYEHYTLEKTCREMILQSIEEDLDAEIWHYDFEDSTNYKIYFYSNEMERYYSLEVHGSISKVKEQNAIERSAVLLNR